MLKSTLGGKFHAFPFFSPLSIHVATLGKKRDHRNMKVLMSSLANEKRVCSGEHPFLDIYTLGPSKAAFLGLA